MENKLNNQTEAENRNPQVNEHTAKGSGKDSAANAAAGRDSERKDGYRRKERNNPQGRYNSNKENRPKRPKQNFVRKGMVYRNIESGMIHDWNCPEMKNVALTDFEEQKEIPILTGNLCPKCGRGLLLKKYTDDKEEGRALSRFFNELEISNEFLCELYEVYHIYPYVYAGALKITYREHNWKIQKENNKLAIYHNEFGENMPGWFNDYWTLSETIESLSLEEAIKIILAKEF